MKVIILAGGVGSRLAEETVLKPKPMVEIGGKPMLWHIMKVYSTYGINEFILALGYKAEIVKDYFLNFYALNSDISIDLATGTTALHNGKQPNWKVHLVDTGLYTQTGGRVKRLQKWLEDEDSFMLTYGDGVGDINLTALLDFHRSHGRIATMTAVRSPARFGRIAFSGDRVTEFYEKPENTEGWINGGYFVLNRRALEYIEGDETVWERGPVERLSQDGQLLGYRHNGFWSCMDTLKEKHFLEELWGSGQAPWKVWF